jgi:hypothetical protein
MAVSDPSQDDGRGLEARLDDIPRQRLIEEVVSRWNDIIRLEGEVVRLRRRLREAELHARDGDVGGSLQSEIEERLRVADARVRQLEGQLQNERMRREGAEIDSSKHADLQEENARLLRNEEEFLLLVMDMETQIDRLTESAEGV